MHMMWEPHANVFNTCLNSKIISALLATFWSYICLFVLLEAFIKKMNDPYLSSHHQPTKFNPIPTGHGRKQPIYERHVTKSGRNRVNFRNIWFDTNGKPKTQ